MTFGTDFRHTYSGICFIIYVFISVIVDSLGTSVWRLMCETEALKFS